MTRQKDWADRLSRAIDEHGFAKGDDDPIRDFMATYFDKDDWNTRAQVVDFLARIIRQAGVIR